MNVEAVSGLRGKPVVICPRIAARPIVNGSRPAAAASDLVAYGRGQFAA